MLLQDIQALIAALQAKDWLSAFSLAVKVSNEIIADLTKKGQQPHVLKLQANATGTDLTTLTADLDSCCNASAINWGNVLAIVAQIIKVLLPIIIGG